MAIQGRPTKYKKKFCQELINHMKKGLSFESFAPTIGVGRTTLYEWTQSHRDFAAAKKIAQDHCRLFWENIGIGVASGKLKNGNAGAWIYNMKCRFPEHWRDEKVSEEDKTINIKLSYDPDS